MAMGKRPQNPRQTSMWVASQDLPRSALAAARAYEFAFVVQPLKIQGGTGSTVAPIAIR